MLEINLTLESTLELDALESALDMYESYAEEAIKDPANYAMSTANVQREIAVCKAGIALLKRIRGGK